MAIHIAAVKKLIYNKQNNPVLDDRPSTHQRRGRNRKHRMTLSQLQSGHCQLPGARIVRIGTCMEIKIEGRRQRKTWLENMEADVTELEMDTKKTSITERTGDCYEEEVQPYWKRTINQ